MTTDKKVEKTGKQLWLFAVLFVTFLFLGNFVVNGDYLDLIYLIILYTFIILIKVTCEKE